MLPLLPFLLSCLQRNPLESGSNNYSGLANLRGNVWLEMSPGETRPSHLPHATLTFCLSLALNLAEVPWVGTEAGDLVLLVSEPQGVNYTHSL